MVRDMDPKQPSLPIWVTVVAVAGVILGGVAGTLTGREYGGGLDVAGAVLGFVAGLALIAFDWFVPRPLPGTTSPVGNESGGNKAGGPGFSSGQRLFAYLCWSLVGIFLLFGCAFGSQKLLDSVYEKFWPMPSLREVAEWEERFGGPRDPIPGVVVPERPDDLDWYVWNTKQSKRMNYAMALGVTLGGVLLLIGYSLLRERLFVGARKVTRDLEGTVRAPQTGAMQAHLRGRWGAISLSVVLIGLFFGTMLCMSSFSMVRASQIHPIGALAWFLIHAFGILAAIIASKQGERRWGVTILGLILNAVLGTIAVTAGLFYH